jgi:hypothetical protein
VKKTSKRTGGSRPRSPARRGRGRVDPAPVPEAALLAFADLAERLGLRWYVLSQARIARSTAGVALHTRRQ